MNALAHFDRKLVRRLEDLIHDSSAVKENLLLQMDSLSNKCQELVNFGISVRPYLKIDQLKTLDRPLHL